MRPFPVKATTEQNSRGCMGCYPEGEPNPDRPLLHIVLGYGGDPLLVCDDCAVRLAASLLADVVGRDQ